MLFSCPVSDSDSASITGGFHSRVLAAYHTSVRHQGTREYSYINDAECLDAPEFVPGGSSVAWTYRGEIVTAGTIVPREQPPFHQV